MVQAHACCQKNLSVSLKTGEGNKVFPFGGHLTSVWKEKSWPLPTSGRRTPNENNRDFKDGDFLWNQLSAYLDLNLIIRCVAYFLPSRPLTLTNSSGLLKVFICNGTGWQYPPSQKSREFCLFSFSLQCYKANKHCTVCNKTSTSRNWGVKYLHLLCCMFYCIRHHFLYSSADWHPTKDDIRLFHTVTVRNSLYHISAYWEY